MRRGEFCIRLPWSHPVPAEGSGMCRTAPRALLRFIPVSPDTCRTPDVSRSESSIPSRHPVRRQTLSPSRTEYPKQSRSQNTHLPANPAAALRPALWPSRAAHSRFIHRPSRSRRVGVVASPLPPMAARFGRAQDGGDISPSASGRGRVEGRYLGGAGTAGTLRAVISFCWGALWRLQARKGGARLGRYGSGLTAL